VTPIASICVPTYNGARYLAPCLESALAQTYEKFEYWSSTTRPRTKPDGGRALRGARRSGSGVPECSQPGTRGELGPLCRARAWSLDQVSLPGRLSRSHVPGHHARPRGARHPVRGDRPSSGFLGRRKRRYPRLVRDSRSQASQGPPRGMAGHRHRGTVRRLPDRQPHDQLHWRADDHPDHRSLFERFGPFISDMRVLVDWEYFARIGVNRGLAFIKEPLATFRVTRIRPRSRKARSRFTNELGWPGHA